VRSLVKFLKDQNSFDFFVQSEVCDTFLITSDGLFLMYLRHDGIEDCSRFTTRYPHVCLFREESIDSCTLAGYLVTTRLFSIAQSKWFISTKQRQHEKNSFVDKVL
jgi:hypothetical protein